jgi:hypothetical protein
MKNNPYWEGEDVRATCAEKREEEAVVKSSKGVTTIVTTYWERDPAEINLLLELRSDIRTRAPTPPGAGAPATGSGPLPRFATHVFKQHPCGALQVREADPMVPR